MRLVLALTCSVLAACAQAPDEVAARQVFARAQTTQNIEERVRLFNEAAVLYRRLVAAYPQRAEGWYALGVIVWNTGYFRLAALRRQSGMKPEDSGPLPDREPPEGLLPAVDGAIANLRRALKIDPDHNGAMAHLNLLYRLRADLNVTREGYARDIARADQWLQKALEGRRGSPPRLRIGADGPRQIKKVMPVRPAVRNSAPEVVRLKVVIGADGKVIQVLLASGHPILADAAMAAVRQWQYPPTLLNGEPVEVISQVEVRFEPR